jgi:multidrug efflux system outer membrane protein
VPEAVNRADLAVPEAWSSPLPEAAVNEALAGWEEFTRDPVLSAMLDEALAYNRNLRAAEARLRQARSLLVIEQAGRRPQLGADASANFAGDVQGNRFPDRHTLGLSASWEIDLWGRLADGVQAQAQSLRATETEFVAARRSLAVQVVKLWYGLLETQAQVRLSAETVENYEANERIILRRFDAGLSSALDVRLARTNLLAAENAWVAAQRQLDARVRALEVLLGRFPSRELEGGGSVPSALPWPDAGVPAELLARRPDLQTAEARYVAAALEAGAARKLRYPQLSLRGNLGTESNMFSDLFDVSRGSWNLLNNLTAPLFQGGRIAGQIEFASAGEEAALEDFAAALLAACQEVGTALEAERLLERQIETTEALAEEAEASERLAWNQYEKGLVSITTVLDAQRRAFESRSQLLALEDARRQNRLDLYLALGGPDLAAPTALPPTN